MNRTLIAFSLVFAIELADIEIVFSKKIVVNDWTLESYCSFSAVVVEMAANGIL